MTIPPARRTLAALIFLCATLLFFARSYPNYFVSDDYEFLGRINLHNAGSYFLKSWGYGNEYRPLLVYTYALNGAFSDFHPAGYHLVNTIIHALNGLMLALILERLRFSSITAPLAAGIFVLNPVAHESVLWIAGRPVILFTLFALCSIWCFLKAVSRPERPALYWMGAYLAFTFALLTYEAAVVIPFLMLLLCAASPVSCSVRRCWKQLAGMFCVLLAYLALWSLLFGFRVTRFPIEHSAVTAAASLAAPLAIASTEARVSGPFLCTLRFCASPGWLHAAEPFFCSRPADFSSRSRRSWRYTVMPTASRTWLPALPPPSSHSVCRPSIAAGRRRDGLPQPP